MNWCKDISVGFKNHAQKFPYYEALRKVEEFETINQTKVYEQEGVTIENNEVYVNVRIMTTFIESKGVITIEDTQFAKDFLFKRWFSLKAKYKVKQFLDYLQICFF